MLIVLIVAAAAAAVVVVAVFWGVMTPPHPGAVLFGPLKLLFQKFHTIRNNRKTNAFFLPHNAVFPGSFGYG